MCTVSWTLSDCGYEVFFSRDENRTRPEGVPPQKWRTEGTPWMAPRDPQGGGTWIWVNQYRMAACIMNAYETDPASDSPGYRSRGLFLQSLAPCPDVNTLAQQAQEELRTHTYRPFFLLAWNELGQPQLWQGCDSELTHLHPPPQPMLSTSSFNPRVVLEARRRMFEAICPPGGMPSSFVLRQFHEDADSTPAPETVRMSRPDARTVSLTRVSVRDEEICMMYRPRPNDAAFGRPMTCRLNPAHAGDTA